ncbi:MAG TPA: CDP-archaeol synthase [Candidatus Saccharibacteria bacterium]|nr:CDP-archaeol synthase [Candidatus Saccharibacteria bacterium]
MNELLLVVWFFLPAGIANASPTWANKIPGINKLNTPLDFGKSINDRRIFGDNKRWRGLIIGVLFGALTGYLQFLIFPTFINELGITSSRPALTMTLLGGLLGLGALLGDAVESFFKRRSRVKPGDSWFPFDQIDYIIGGIALSLPIVVLDIKTYLLLLIVWFSIHLIAGYIGFMLKLKDKPI